MSAAAPGWKCHEIIDGARRGVTFEVFVRGTPRATASGAAVVPTDASHPGATWSQKVVAGGDSSPQNTVVSGDASEESPLFNPLETTISPGQESNGRARSLPPTGSPALRPHDRASATPSTTPTPDAVRSGVSMATTAFGGLPSVKAIDGNRRYGSIDTLRRRVKSGALPREMSDGRYVVSRSGLDSMRDASAAERAFSELQAAAKRAAAIAPPIAHERHELILAILRGASR